MEIVYRKLADLIPNPKNPRKQSEQGVEALAESIRENPLFFEARPILLSNRTGVLMIIAGERRKEAAELLGMTEAPTILIEGLNEAQEDAILVQDNTHSGVWDDAKLYQWSGEQLAAWGAPHWEKVPEEELDKLFEPTRVAKEKGVEIHVLCPKEYNDKANEIARVIKEALAKDFPGCVVK